MGEFYGCGGLGGGEAGLEGGTAEELLVEAVIFLEERVVTGRGVWTMICMHIILLVILVFWWVIRHQIWDLTSTPYFCFSIIFIPYL